MSEPEFGPTRIWRMASERPNPWAPDAPPQWWRPGMRWCPQVLRPDGYYSSRVCRVTPRKDSDLCGPHYHRQHPLPPRPKPPHIVVRGPELWYMLEVSIIVNNLQHNWLTARDWFELGGHEADIERLRGALAEVEARWLSARERANRAEDEIKYLKQEVQRLLVDNAELSDECDQWGEKLFAVWAEVNSLRAQLAQHGG